MLNLGQLWTGLEVRSTVLAVVTHPFPKVARLVSSGAVACVQVKTAHLQGDVLHGQRGRFIVVMGVRLRH